MSRCMPESREGPVFGWECMTPDSANSLFFIQTSPEPLQAELQRLTSFPRLPLLGVREAWA